MSISVIYLSKGVQKGVLEWVKKVKKPIFSRARGDRQPIPYWLLLWSRQCLLTIALQHLMSGTRFLPIFGPKMVQKMGVYTPNGSVPGGSKKRGQNETPFGGSWARCPRRVTYLGRYLSRGGQKGGPKMDQNVSFSDILGSKKVVTRFVKKCEKSWGVQKMTYFGQFWSKTEIFSRCEGHVFSFRK